MRQATTRRAQRCPVAALAGPLCALPAPLHACGIRRTVTSDSPPAGETTAAAVSSADRLLGLTEGWPLFCCSLTGAVLAACRHYADDFDESDAKLANREGAKGKDDGKSSLLQPANDFYKNLAVECSKQQVCIDVWNCSGAYADLATIGQLSKHTGGAVYHYPGFSDVTMGEKLSRDLQHNLTREQGWEAVMRVRITRGLRITAFHGHFFIRGKHP